MMLLTKDEIKELPTYKSACWSWSDGERSGSDDDLQRGEVEELLKEALEAQLKKVAASLEPLFYFYDCVESTCQVYLRIKSLFEETI